MTQAIAQLFIAEEFFVFVPISIGIAACDI